MGEDGFLRAVTAKDIADALDRFPPGGGTTRVRCVNVIGPSAYSFYGPVACRDRERFVSGSKNGLWDGAEAQLIPAEWRLRVVGGQAAPPE